MNVERYLQQRRERQALEPKFRILCDICHQPDYGCYCPHIRRFDPGLKVVILIHPIEARRRIATGRMSHLTLENSELIMGHNYSTNVRVNEIIGDPKYSSVILYPGRLSKNITHQTPEERAQIFAPDRQPVIFVIDGTWATARQMINKSKNLQTLSRVCFSPSKPSTFRVRKQPAPGCVSTIEAIHHTLELLSVVPRFASPGQKYDQLLFVFDKMVEKQLEFVPHSWANPRRARGRAFTAASR